MRRCEFQSRRDYEGDPFRDPAEARAKLASMSADHPRRAELQAALDEFDRFQGLTFFEQLAEVQDIVDEANRQYDDEEQP